MTLKIISIEGNIGSGKSTLVEGLKQKYKAQEHICFLQEPVDEWSCVRDNDGKTILEKYYGNQEICFLISNDGLYFKTFSIKKRN